MLIAENANCEERRKGVWKEPARSLQRVDKNWPELGKNILTSNPFAELSAIISPAVMQACAVVKIILVAAGTVFDVVHRVD